MLFLGKIILREVRYVPYSNDSPHSGYAFSKIPPSDKNSFLCSDFSEVAVLNSGKKNLARLLRSQGESVGRSRVADKGKGCVERMLPVRMRRSECAPSNAPTVVDNRAPRPLLQIRSSCEFRAKYPLPHPRPISSTPLDMPPPSLSPSAEYRIAHSSIGSHKGSVLNP